MTCPKKCWKGYKRVSGKGCGKGSCRKKRSYRNFRNVTMREGLAATNRLDRRKQSRNRKKISSRVSRGVKKGFKKLKKRLTLPKKLRKPFDPETGYFGKTQRQIRRSYKKRSKRRRKRRSKRRKSKKSRMKCNRVKKSYRRGKKFMVKACSRGKKKLIHFGATGYGHNYSRKARKSFRARHRCKSAKNKLTARYWSCKHSWTRGGSRRRCPKGRRCKR